MCTMKEASERVGLSYETLKFYCKEGLVPNIRRDKNNYRDFDERNLKWIESLLCLRRCGLSIDDMKAYMQLCLQGRSSITQRQQMLAGYREKLLEDMKEIQSSIDYIDYKNNFYDEILSGEREYTSNLIDVKECSAG